MRHNRPLLRSLLAGLAAALAAAGTAAAQQAPPPDAPPPLLPAGPPPSPFVSGLQVIATPYLWLAGVNSAISTPLRRAPEVDSSVGAFQLLGHLDGVPFLGSVEISDGPLSLLGGAIHLPVGTDITTRNVFLNGGSAMLNANAGTALLLYHALHTPVQWFDAGLGFRAWNFYSNLTLNGRIVPTISITRQAQWADPLLGARYHREFGNGWGATAYGDFGGFGVGAHVDWQVIGTIDYVLKPWVALHVGYRAMGFDYTAEGGGLGFNVHMKGPLFGATFQF
jgi:hypothetical protein